MVRFLPLAILTPLRALCVGSIAQANHVSPDSVNGFAVTAVDLHDKNISSIDGQNVADASSPIIVTEDNFPQAYSNLRFDNIIKNTGGVNQFLEMPVAPSDPSKQFVVRMNRDTYYSTAIFDMTGGIYITIPETDKYISVQVVDENHETQPMIYGPGRHKLTAKTKHAFIVVRTLDDQARRNLKTETNSSDSFVVKEWDDVSLLQILNIFLQSRKVIMH